ncbi:hypothetical protein HYFRA_00008923 [Hymenoscyphus fraxineus]|uniref:G domain-containing protein n=1 Tax=Hymenoscyphus fraxineus TaxID=746836 RepID=A0A9N9KT79_9HELO|nr:hypothetical protein HYFRA_00008923 [Hymenoscyphus fraxineus]
MRLNVESLHYAETVPQDSQRRTFSFPIALNIRRFIHQTRPEKFDEMATEEWEGHGMDLVLVMGLTGAGKTYFINQLTGQGLAEGHNLASCTETCQIVATNIGNTEFAIMDCPGFDDTRRSDADILKEISEQLSAIRIIGFNLKGIIYLRRITDNRMAGSEVRTLDFFQKLVGEEALPHVVLATTMWQKVVDLEEANDRDSELRDEYWGEMRRKGSSATRFEGTTDSAQGIVSQLLGKRPVVLKVQEQLVDQRMSLNQTEAGAFLEPKIGIDEEKFRKRLKELEIEIQTEKDANKRLQAKQSVRRNAAGLKKRMEDKETIKSKPGVEVQNRMSKLKEGTRKYGKSAAQVLAAVCSITFTLVQFLI